MKLNDLETGMRVETRNGNIYVILQNISTTLYNKQSVILVNDCLVIPGIDYDENLIHIEIRRYDIMKVFKASPIHKLSDFNTEISENCLIWERLKKV